ncbi:hypothetical protein [Streptomyces sp. NPDC008122]|uniref:hypothetical protein n=1 Tax=Streptomyces sp. NPDC008122 TaxID=3364810 RepID=UPI0036F0D1DE
MTSRIRAAVVCGAAAAMLGLGVTPASAAGAKSCPSDGWITRWDRCSTLSNGVLSVSTNTTGTSVGVAYWRSSGGALTAKLGYERNSTNYWFPYRNMSTVPLLYQEQASITASCGAIIGKLYTSGGATYTTPAADPC